MSEVENQAQQGFWDACKALSENWTILNDGKYNEALAALKKSLGDGADPYLNHFGIHDDHFNMLRSYSDLPPDALEMINDNADDPISKLNDKDKAKLIEQFAAELNADGLKWLAKKGIQPSNEQIKSIATHAINGFLIDCNVIGSTAAEQGSSEATLSGDSPSFPRLVETLRYLQTRDRSASGGHLLQGRTANGAYSLVEELTGELGKDIPADTMQSVANVVTAALDLAIYISPAANAAEASGNLKVYKYLKDIGYIESGGDVQSDAFSHTNSQFKELIKALQGNDSVHERVRFGNIHETAQYQLVANLRASLGGAGCKNVDKAVDAIQSALVMTQPVKDIWLPGENPGAARHFSNQAGASQVNNFAAGGFCMSGGMGDPVPEVKGGGVHEGTALPSCKRERT